MNQESNDETLLEKLVFVPEIRSRMKSVLCFNHRLCIDHPLSGVSAEFCGFPESALIRENIWKESRFLTFPRNIADRCVFHVSRLLTFQKIRVIWPENSDVFGISRWNCYQQPNPLSAFSVAPLPSPALKVCSVALQGTSFFFSFFIQRIQHPSIQSFSRKHTSIQASNHTNHLCLPEL